MNRFFLVIAALFGLAFLSAEPASAQLTHDPGDSFYDGQTTPVAPGSTEIIWPDGSRTTINNGELTEDAGSDFGCAKAGNVGSYEYLCGELNAGENDSALTGVACPQGSSQGNLNGREVCSFGGDSQFISAFGSRWKPIDGSYPWEG